MIIEALILMGSGYVASRYVKIEFDERAQNAARKLLELGLAQIPNAVKTLQATGSRFLSQAALPSKSEEVEVVEKLGAEELDKIIRENAKKSKI
jgi:hypothetical protein